MRVYKDFRKVRNWGCVTEDDILASWDAHGYYAKDHNVYDDRTKSERYYQQLPINLRTERVYKRALTYYGGYLPVDNPDLITEGMFRYLIKLGRYNGKMARDFSQLIKSYEDATLLVESDYTSLGYIPSEFIDYDLCYKAASSNSYCKSRIPSEFLDFEMWLALVISGSGLHDVPLEFQTAEFFTRYLTACPDKLAWISSENWTTELVSLACQKSYTSLIRALSVRPDLVTEALILSCDDNSDFDLIDIPEEFRTKVVCLKFLEVNPRRVCSIPSEYLSDPFFIENVLKVNIQTVDYGLRSHLNYRTATWYLGNGGSLSNVDSHLQDYDLCSLAINSDVRNLRFVRNKTLQLCIQAYQIDSDEALRIIENKTYKKYLRKYGNNPEVKPFHEFLEDLEAKKREFKDNRSWNKYYGVKEVSYQRSNTVHLCMECIEFNAVEKKLIPHQIKDKAKANKCYECGKENKKV